ncbi:coiled-coil domain-containing protein 93-like [Pollicipes pollicipes]|uniref:coiled-coil domain-containing protein 93-like n=1 Tax=Pollicipes pollicipes TaxID=41117 RepID=UPI001884F0AA|nr:coiled-coil domain-containing protein 93-like [Pollicipes pollicipes]
MAAFQLQADVRDDEEQQLKFQECLDLLLAAGYFRARIRGLSAFDKLVGGMVWCIEMCSMDVNVDLFYKDELSIGQKIGVTERIIEVLPQMACPHRVEPHQIQGLDCVHIFPVIQWLVKKALENQAETVAYTVGYGEFLFLEWHPELASPRPPPDRCLLRQAEERFRRVERPVAPKSSDAESAAPPEPAEPSLQPGAEAVAAMLGVGEIAQAAKAYEQQTRQLQESGLDADQHGRLLAAEVTDGLSPAALATLEAILTSFQEADAILSEDQAFKEECKAEYTKLQDEISRLQAQAAPADDDPQTEHELARRTAAVDRLRAEVASASRQVALLERQLDDVPSRAEIGQYQKRFVELYNQVSSTHKEAKEYYATNNLLSDTLRYLEKELALLNSVAESYQAASGSAAGRTEFLQQLDSIVLNINNNKKKVLAKKQTEKRAVDVLTEQLDGLRALARNYHAALKQFRSECAANEALTAAERR